MWLCNILTNVTLKKKHIFILLGLRLSLCNIKNLNFVSVPERFLNVLTKMLIVLPIDKGFRWYTPNEIVYMRIEVIYINMCIINVYTHNDPKTDCVSLNIWK